MSLSCGCNQPLSLIPLHIFTRFSTRYSLKPYLILCGYFLDPRTEEIVAGRSINLSLSKRGIESLKRVGVDAAVSSFIGFVMIVFVFHKESFFHFLETERLS